MGHSRLTIHFQDGVVPAGKQPCPCFLELCLPQPQWPLPSPGPALTWAQAYMRPHGCNHFPVCCSGLQVATQLSALGFPVPSPKVWKSKSRALAVRGLPNLRIISSDYVPSSEFLGLENKTCYNSCCLSPNYLSTHSSTLTINK